MLGNREKEAGQRSRQERDKEGLAGCSTGGRETDTQEMEGDNIGTGSQNNVYTSGATKQDGSLDYQRSAVDSMRDANSGGEEEF